MEQIRIGVELRALNNAVRRYFEFASHDHENSCATGNQKWIIHYLVENEGRAIYQKDIETRFNIARSTASKVLNLMEQKGLIRRQPVAQDARLKQIVLTDAAWQFQDQMRKESEKLERALTHGFTEDELQMLSSYLQRMRDNLI